MKLHRHPINQKHYDDMPLSTRAAYKVRRALGTWRFLMIQTLIIAAWIGYNAGWIWFNVHTGWANLFTPWDLPPFILLNLCLSLQAAYTGPLLQLANNASEDRDRQFAEHQYQEIESIKETQSVIERKLDAFLAKGYDYLCQHPFFEFRNLKCAEHR